MVAATEPKTEVTLVILREGKEREIKVRLEERPEDQQVSTQVQPKAVEKVGLEVSDITSELVQKYH